MSDYLWDGSGEPDPEVEGLEEALGGLRYRGELPELPARDAGGGEPRPYMGDAGGGEPRPYMGEAGGDESRPYMGEAGGGEPRPYMGEAGGGEPRPYRPWLNLLVAAVVLLATGATLYTSRPQRRVPAGPSWSVDTLEGSAWISAHGTNPHDRLAVGEWLETGEASKVRLQTAGVGLIDVGPNSRVRLVTTKPSEHRLELARGRLEATVTAPPKLFFVDTPAAEAIDLGCAYSLEVDEGGAGLLEVRLGFVALEDGGRRAIVPSGGRCGMRPGQGPGTPYGVEAPAELIAALERWDFAGQATADLDVVLRLASEDDAPTLWHLLQRVIEAERPRVYERLAAVDPPPEGVTREAALRLDPEALEAWRLSVGLGW